MATATAVSIATGLITAGVTAGVSVLAEQGLPKILDWIDEKVDNVFDEVDKKVQLTSPQYIISNQAENKSRKKSKKSKK